MDDQGCPRCKTTKYRNPSLKLLVNVCGHSLCESCVDLLFIKGSGNCPECDTALRRNNFRLQLFEDAYVEKEVDIRKKILKDFNKKEEDFVTLRDYNDYLENLETIIFNLTNSVDVDNTKRMVDQYKKENKEFIQKNRTKLSKDEEYLEQLIAEEQHGARERRELDRIQELNEKNTKKKNKEELIDELMFSDLSASAILAGHQATTKDNSADISRPLDNKFSSGAAFSFSSSASAGLQIPGEVGQEFLYQPMELEILGPAPPTETDVVHKGYLQNIRAASDADKGGGYDSRLACQRALMEAMCGLYLYPET